MKHIILALAALSLGACVQTTRMSYEQQTVFLEAPRPRAVYVEERVVYRVREPIEFRLADKGDYGFGAGE